MAFWRKVAKPFRKVCSKFSKRVGFRETGHGQLLNEVQSCEYEDVRILWELLKRNDTSVTRSTMPRLASKGGKDDMSHFGDWGRSAPFLYRA